MKYHLRNLVVSLLIVLTTWGCAHDKNKSATSHKAVQMPLVINIDGDGSLAIAKQPCPADQFSSRLAKLPDSRVRPVVIEADERAPHSKVKEVMDACKTAGFQQVSLKSVK
ncbi:MAG TPA: biopolymer transporter ExbD [Verrucomicrobiae bacterium]